MDQLFNYPMQVHLITQHVFQILTDQERCLPVELNCNCNLFVFYKSKLRYNPVDIDIVTYIPI